MRLNGRTCGRCCWRRNEPVLNRGILPDSTLAGTTVPMRVSQRIMRICRSTGVIGSVRTRPTVQDSGQTFSGNGGGWSSSPRRMERRLTWFRSVDVRTSRSGQRFDRTRVPANCIRTRIFVVRTRKPPCFGCYSGSRGLDRGLVLSGCASFLPLAPWLPGFPFVASSGPLALDAS